MERLVHKPVEFTLAEFEALPRVEVFAGFHCVTRWSGLDNAEAGKGALITGESRLGALLGWLLLQRV